MRCFKCKKEIIYEYKAILISCDGDFVCDENCKKNYIIERDRFFNDIIVSEDKCKEWLLGKNFGF
tara:strand:- start:144 stop:338 length:195 start_codon:yes stop_codon:yes gene_type:complete